MAILSGSGTGYPTVVFVPGPGSMVYLSSQVLDFPFPFNISGPQQMWGLFPPVTLPAGRVTLPAGRHIHLIPGKIKLHIRDIGGSWSLGLGVQMCAGSLLVVAWWAWTP